jgi:hypothetical protein
MRAAAVAAVMAVTLVVPALAQTPTPETGGGSAVAAGAPPAAQSDAQAPPVDATKLGVSMSRIKRGLRLSEAREQTSGSPLKLEYQIQVFGTAPRIDVLGDFDIRGGAPLSYGAPTHSDFVNQWTPQAYRSPRVPLSSLAGWALFQMVKRSDKSKCEQEIAEYRALVMQGISAPAPRCTQ